LCEGFDQRQIHTVGLYPDIWRLRSDTWVPYSLDGQVVVTGHEWSGHCRSTASSESCLDVSCSWSFQNTDGATEDREMINIERLVLNVVKG
jgi:hypothetical protein